MELYETVDSAMDAECAHLCIYCTLCVTAHAAVLRLDAAPYAAVRGILQTTEKEMYVMLLHGSALAAVVYAAMHVPCGA